MDDTEKKFGQLYDDHIEQIYRFVFLRVSSVELAQDITSETFTKCWQSYRQNPDNIQNPRAFLYKIAHNLVVDHYRRKSKDQTISADISTISVADPKMDFVRNAMLASDMETVRKAMAAQNPDYQNALTWHYLDDLSIKEIAHLLDRTEDATRVLLHRALKDLKTRLS